MMINLYLNQCKKTCFLTQFFVTHWLYFVQLGFQSWLFNNSFLSAELKDILLNQNYNKHNNRLRLDAILFCNFHIHKKIDKHPLAFSLLFYVCSLDKWFLILIWFPYYFFFWLKHMWYVRSQRWVWKYHCPNIINLHLCFYSHRKKIYGFFCMWSD